MLLDLHVHVGAAGLAPQAVLERARALQLDGVALVDDGRFPDVAALRESAGGLVVLAGAEVETDRGHYLVFLPRPEQLPPLDQIFGTARPWPVRDVLARTQALGGAVVCAHPYDRSIPHPAGDVIFTLRGLTAVETVNPARPPEIARPAIEAADYLELPKVGGSDARRDPAEVGRGATLFVHRIEDEAGLIEALWSGRCWPVEYGAPPARRPRTSAPEAGSERARERSPEQAPGEGEPPGSSAPRRRRRGGRSRSPGAAGAPPQRAP